MEKGVWTGSHLTSWRGEFSGRGTVEDLQKGRVIVGGPPERKRMDPDRK